MAPYARIAPNLATSLLARVAAGAPRRSGPLCVWPLVARDPVSPPPGVGLIAFATAAAAGTARIEIPPGRSYRALRASVQNGGDVAVLLFAGEAPLATRPRWRCAASTLVPPHASVEILVRSAPRDGARCAAIEREFSAPPLADQLGFVASLDGIVVGAELVGRGDIFETARRTLLAPYARAAVWEPEFVLEEAPLDSPEALIERMRAARCIAEPAHGLAEALRLHARGAVGRGLVCGDVLHLSLRCLGDDGEPLVKFR